MAVIIVVLSSIKDLLRGPDAFSPVERLIYRYYSTRLMFAGIDEIFELMKFPEIKLLLDGRSVTVFLFS